MTGEWVFVSLGLPAILVVGALALTRYWDWSERRGPGHPRDKAAAP